MVISVSDLFFVKSDRLPAYKEAIMEINADDKAVRIVLIYHDLTGTYVEEPDYK